MIIRLIEDLNTKTNKKEYNNILSSINSIYEQAGVKNDVERALFYLICFRTVQGKKPVNYNLFLEFVLKWSFSESAKNISNFPNTKTVLNTVLEDFVLKLKNNKLIIDREYEGYGRLIALLQDDKQKELIVKRDVDIVSEIIRDEYGKAVNLLEYPFPTIRSVQAILIKNNANIDLSLLCKRPETYDESDDKEHNDAEYKVFGIEYTNNNQDYMVVAQELYRTMPAEVSKKMYRYSIGIIPEKGNASSGGNILVTVNTILRRNFPGDNFELGTLLSPDRVNIRNLWTENDPFLNRWLFIFKELNDHIINILKMSGKPDLCNNSICFSYVPACYTEKKNSDKEGRKEPF